eukprot:PITA_21793
MDLDNKLMLGLVSNTFIQVLVSKPMLCLDNKKCNPVFNNNLMLDLFNKITLIKVISIKCLILAYQTSVRNATGFTPFQLVYGLEAILPKQCKISFVKLAIDLLPDTSKEEVCFLELIHLDETRRESTLANEAHKKRIKEQYDRNVKPRIFSEGDLVLLYDQEADKLRARKFELLWMGPYIVKCFLEKGAYELVDYDGIPLSQPRNGLYLKCYYS